MSTKYQLFAMLLILFGSSYQSAANTQLNTVKTDATNGFDMVRIPGKNYEMGKYEVTQSEWQTVMGFNPSYFKGENLPVDRVSYNDIQEFLAKFNQKTGKQFRLPKEAEWEYACYGGSRTSYYCGSNEINDVAWYKDNSGSHTHSIGQKQANSYGLYDMTGNVLEWTEDCDDNDCVSRRVLRGGSWNDLQKFSSVTYRYRTYSTGSNNSFGFRLARTLP